jgi:hypothetical protein
MVVEHIIIGSFDDKNKNPNKKLSTFNARAVFVPGIYSVFLVLIVCKIIKNESIIILLAMATEDL